MTAEHRERGRVADIVVRVWGDGHVSASLRYEWVERGDERQVAREQRWRGSLYSLSPGRISAADIHVGDVVVFAGTPPDVTVVHRADPGEPAGPTWSGSWSGPWRPPVLCPACDTALETVGTSDQGLLQCPNRATCRLQILGRLGRLSRQGGDGILSSLRSPAQAGLGRRQPSLRPHEWQAMLDAELVQDERDLFALTTSALLTVKSRVVV